MNHEAGGLNLSKPVLHVFCESRILKMIVTEREGCFSIKLTLFRPREKKALRLGFRYSMIGKRSEFMDFIHGMQSTSKLREIWLHSGVG